MAEVIRLLIIDDHKFFRNALIAPFYDEPQFEVVAEAPNGLVAKEMVAEFSPDVVIMDLHMPYLNGVQTTQQLVQIQKNKGCDLGIVVVTGDTDPVIAIQAINAGARGYLLKDRITDEVLFCAIRAAHLGGFYLEPQVLKNVLNFLSKRHTSSTVEGSKWQRILSTEELQLIFDIAKGKENAEIACENQVSSKTVSNRLSKLYNTLGVANRVQLVTFSLCNDIISLDDC